MGFKHCIECCVGRSVQLVHLIFDIGGSRKIAVIGPKGQNLFAAVAQCTAKKEPGNPDKDLGNVRNLAYLALNETANFQPKSRICEMRYVVYSAWRVFCSCF